MKTVAVLLSTYNGETFLSKQIDSLLNQKDVNLKIVIRDDGSKDNTLSILQQYATIHSCITILKEDNIGAVMSFHRLCQYAKDNVIADYYAFCDQDDVWLDEKLRIAVCKLDSYDKEKPNLYFSNLQMVDTQLNPIRKLFETGEVKISKHMALIQVFTYGCTCVFNRSALEAYCCADFSKELCHDNWIYILSQYLGNVYYDEESYILYRQHGSNVSGAKVTGLKLACQRIRRAFTKKWGHEFELYASMLLLCFGAQLGEDDRNYANRVANYRHSIFKKLSLLFSSKYRTSSLSKNIAIKIRIIANRL